MIIEPKLLKLHFNFVSNAQLLASSMLNHERILMRSFDFSASCTFYFNQKCIPRALLWISRLKLVKCVLLLRCCDDDDDAGAAGAAVFFRSLFLHWAKKGQKGNLFTLRNVGHSHFSEPKNFNWILLLDVFALVRLRLLRQNGPKKKEPILRYVFVRESMLF